jgi:hypothetical protein
VHSSPEAEGAFNIDQVRNVLKEAKKIETVEWIYFEGGEATTLYPLLLESLRLGKKMGFKTGLVSNVFFANTVEDAEIWLRPLGEVGIDDLSISDDNYHSDDGANAKNATQAAEKLGLPLMSICIEEAKILEPKEHKKGEPVVGGDVLFKGRAAEKLTAGLPRRNWSELNSCPHEELIHPERVHVDAYGHVQVCQGISIGNMWEMPLSEIIENYDVNQHKICKPLVAGGPAELARAMKSPHRADFIDECHLCYTIRKNMVDRFPKELAPRQLYGL